MFFLAKCDAYFEKSFDGFSLCVPALLLRERMTTALVGRSGAGKTTLINCLLGMTGQVEYSDRSPLLAVVLHLSLAQRWQTLWECVELESEARRSPIDQLRLVDYLNHLNLDKSVLEKRVWEVSHGMRQRFEIAKALAFDPELILFDEACSGIDAGTKPRVFELLDRHLKSHDCALLFVTHDFGEVARLADRVLVMDKGRIVDTFDVAESRQKRLAMSPADLLQLDVSKKLVAAIY